MRNEPVSASWRKSTRSNGERSCVEVADLEIPGSGMAVRDTQNREMGYLTFPAVEWRAFLTEVTDL